jgi:molecular chaperone GrpE
VVVTMAKAQVSTELLPVLDDIERAEQHGDLTGAFKSVADKLIAALQRAGLESFGHEGEPFDPAVHEAVQHTTSPDVTGPTVTAVLRRGYKFGDRVVRAALVGVTDHEPAPVVEGETVDEGSANDWFEPVADAPPPRDDGSGQS